MSKRTNPRNRPRNEQDVKRAFEKGKAIGVEVALNIMLITLKDLGEPDEYISKFNVKFNRTLASINEKDIKAQDIVDALRDDYELELQYAEE